jgi:predicted amidophosphoribosyltransferase
MIYIIINVTYQERPLMRKLVKVTKITRVFRVAEILGDLLTEATDEELLEKYKINLKQLEKIYCRLFYGGFLDKDDMIRRIELRLGKDASHIPFAELPDAGATYECEICGFASSQHFSACPRCRQLNLRRLTRSSRAPRYAAAPA